jgi:starch synthase
MDSLKVLFCSPEVTPYAKTGGLADVSAALPAELNRQGVECSVVMPLYREIINSRLQMRHTLSLSVLTGEGPADAQVYSSGRMFFIAHPLFSDRTGLYSYAGYDYPDNIERFSFFSRACVELVRALGTIDVVHCNDWQTALVPAYMREALQSPPGCLFTIHNLAYQGIFDAILWPMLFLPQEYFNPECMEFYGRINIMKAGIVFSEAVNTVSPTYAREIQTEEFGCGLEGLLTSVRYKLSGIVNGIDIQTWNPGTDPYIAGTFSRDDLSGKRLCKKALCETFSFDDADAPVFGFIGRLVEQKGVDCMLEMLPGLLDAGARIAVLGSGNPDYEKRLAETAVHHKGCVGVRIGFDESLAHAIEAGSDFFLMPSRFEPCGLNQMISMRYGTIPIVTCVGGLRDTVKAIGETDTPFGIRVASPTASGLLEASLLAVKLYRGDRPLVDAMISNAMEQDVSWTGPAREYAQLYRNLKKIRESRR